MNVQKDGDIQARTTKKKKELETSVEIGEC